MRDEAKYVERAVTNPNGYVAYVQSSNALKMAKTFLYPSQQTSPEEVGIFLPTLCMTLSARQLYCFPHRTGKN
ncbi:TPA: hypothetical protein SIA26_004583 [Aeromonas bestiarum]|nr:hypothetical protein [Aeromonas bestiarum]HEH9406989.1 hypothetical protein [Aeromonas bestiarum]